MTIETLIGFDGRIHIVDVGAALLAQTPPYQPLLDRALARLSAVDGDARQIEPLRSRYGPETEILGLVLGDGCRRPLHLCGTNTGMSSLLRPSERQLAFFNGFPQYGAVQSTMEVETVRLADVPALQEVDFLKMDIQGAELMVLDHAGSALDRCVAIQIEASFVALYEDQPSFGDVDRWMRAHGFQPHRFMEVKLWPIAPTVRGSDFRSAFHQLLECDIVYMKGLVDLAGLDDDQIRKMLLIAAYCYDGPDLMVHCARELERRGNLPAETFTKLLEAFVAKGAKKQAGQSPTS